MSRPAPVRPLAAGLLERLPGLAHGFFPREGGQSQGVFAGLNCGYGSGDDPELVAANRALAAAALGVQARRLVTPYQTHGSAAACLEAPFTPAEAPRVDALATRTAGLSLGILAADCAAVLFADPEARVVAAAHAGWRGALAGILEAAVAAMERLGAVRGRILAAIGPSISRPAYEVDAAFRARILAAGAGHARLFEEGARAGHFQFDLPGFVRGRLEEAGLAAIEDLALCTYREEARFYSFRRSTHRGEAQYGRHLAAIVLHPEADR